MSSIIWTPAALSSEFQPIEATAWRMVEAQHHVATLKLTDSLDEQSTLEQLLDKDKPTIPPECRHLDYLLFTPFRYPAFYPTGSRFRRAGPSHGVFYAAFDVSTAVAEMAFYRLLFYAESPGTAPPAGTAEFTALEVALKSDRSIDLTRAPFDVQRSLWTHPTDYSHTQQLSDDCRSAGGDIIIYESVRDPAAAKNLALLTCHAFSAPAPITRQTWRIKISHSNVQALCEFPRRRIQFEKSHFDSDPRLS